MLLYFVLLLPAAYPFSDSMAGEIPWVLVKYIRLKSERKDD